MNKKTHQNPQKNIKENEKKKKSLTINNLKSIFPVHGS